MSWSRAWSRRPCILPRRLSALLLGERGLGRCGTDSWGSSCKKMRVHLLHSPYPCRGRFLSIPAMFSRWDVPHSTRTAVEATPSAGVELLYLSTPSCNGVMAHKRHRFKPSIRRLPIPHPDFRWRLQRRGTRGSHRPPSASLTSLGQRAPRWEMRKGTHRQCPVKCLMKGELKAKPSQMLLS